MLRGMGYSRIAAVLFGWLLLGGGALGAPLDRSGETVGQLETELDELDREIEALQQALAAEQDGSRAAARLRWELVEALRRRAWVHHWLDVKRSPRGAAIMMRSAESKADLAAAAQALEALLQHRPGWPRRAEAELTAAVIARERGRYDEMAELLERLLERHPGSRHAARAALMLGHYRFDRGRYDEARRSFRRALKAAGREHRAEAHYFLGWLDLNAGDCRGALRHFERVARGRRPVHSIGGMTSQPDVDLRHEALLAMTHCYPEVRPAGGALAYFQRFPVGAAATREALARLAQRYWVKEQLAPAARLFQYLIENAADPEKKAEWRSKLDDIERLLAEPPPAEPPPAEPPPAETGP